MTDTEYITYWREQYQSAQRAIAEGIMREAKLRAALTRVEWVADAREGMEGFSICPWCEAFSDEPHAADCARRLALAPEKH